MRTGWGDLGGVIWGWEKSLNFDRLQDITLTTLIGETARIFIKILSLSSAERMKFRKDFEKTPESA